MRQIRENGICACTGAFRGGWAIDMFLGYESRIHGDIDVCAYWNERDRIIRFMQSQGFYVYEMPGGGRAHRIVDLSNQMRTKRNIFCFKEGCPLVKLYPHDENDCCWIEFFTLGKPSLTLLNFFSMTGRKLSLNMPATGK